MKCFAVLLCLALACQAKNMTRVLLTDAATSKVRRQLYRPTIKAIIDYTEPCPLLRCRVRCAWTARPRATSLETGPAETRTNGFCTRWAAAGASMRLTATAEARHIWGPPNPTQTLSDSGAFSQIAKMSILISMTGILSSSSTAMGLLLQATCKQSACNIIVLLPDAI